MKRSLLLHALTMTCLLACGGKQPAPAQSPPEAQQPAAEATAPEPAEETPEEPVEQEPEKPALPPMPEGPNVWEGEAVGAWIAAVVAQQKKSKQQIRVRVPLVVASDGWGCMCPQNFIGNSPDTHNGGDTWITVDASGLSEPEKQRLLSRESGEGEAKDAGDDADPDAVDEEPFRGAVFIVEGYFPGTRTKVDLRDKRKQPREWLYKTWDLRVTAIVGTAEPAEDLFVHSEQPVEAKTK